MTFVVADYKSDSVDAAKVTHQAGTRRTPLRQDLPGDRLHDATVPEALSILPLLAFFLWPLAVTIAWATVRGSRSRQWAVAGRLAAAAVLGGWALCVVWAAGWLIVRAVIVLTIQAVAPQFESAVPFVMFAVMFVTIVLGTPVLWRTISKEMPDDPRDFRL